MKGLLGLMGLMVLAGCGEAPVTHNTKTDEGVESPDTGISVSDDPESPETIYNIEVIQEALEEVAWSRDQPEREFSFYGCLATATRWVYEFLPEDLWEYERNRMKEPAELWQIYMQYKPIALVAIEDLGLTQEAFEEAKKAHRHFARPIPSRILLGLEKVNRLRSEHEDSYDKVEACVARQPRNENGISPARELACPEEDKASDRLYDEFEQAMLELRNMNRHFERDYLLTKFRLRREAEGGAAIVTAWAEILQDFTDSLPRQN